MISNTIQSTFYTKLFESISNPKSEQHNDDDICLISGEKLDNTKVTLMCNHSFNYVHIFNELVMQKYNPSTKEIQKLTHYQLKCPYCRNIQDYIIPPLEGFTKKRYINTPVSKAMNTHKCVYKFKSGKRKNQECNNPCLQDYCISHIKYKNKLKQNEQTTTLCDSIIISGKRKGEICGIKAKYNNKCGRHKNKV